MNRIFSLPIVLLTTMSFTTAQEQRTLRFQVDGVKNDTVYLANYYGNKLYYSDTAVADTKGAFRFAPEEGLHAGVYAVVVPGPKYFEVLVNEPELVMSTDTTDLSGNLNIEKSEENTVFYEYIRFLNTTRKDADLLRSKLSTTTDPMRKAELKADMGAIDGKVMEYQRTLIKENPDKFVASLVNMSMSVDLEQPTKADGTLDTSASYFQYRTHFWDNFNLKDDRIVRTPVFHNKLQEYVKKVVPQAPDSVNRLVDELIARTEEGSEVFKYIVHFVTYEYETSDIMGMDAVFAHMGRTYYCDSPTGASRAFWMEADRLKKMCERVDKLEPLLIGKKAPYLKLPDTTEQNWISFYDLEADYTVLVFWDPHCGHCKKELPILAAAYADTLKPMGVEIYAVAKAVEEKTFSDWKKFVRENDLQWINVGLTYNVYKDAKENPLKYVPTITTLESLNYSDTYDVYSTPKVFIVDKDQVFVGKQLAAAQIVDFIQRLKEREVKGSRQP